MFRTVQGRLTGVALIATLLSLTIGAVVLLALLERSLVREVDQSIRNRAFDVSVEVDITNSLDPSSFPNDPETFVGIIEDPFGLPILDVHNDDEPSVEALLAIFDSIDEAFDEPTNGSVESITLTEGSDNLRVVFMPVELGDELVVAARTLDGVDRTIAEARRFAVVSVSLLTLFVGGLVYLLAGRALQPVERMRSEVESISGGDLGRRLPLRNDDVGTSESSQNEIDRLAITMNSMLGRLEESQEMQRRFTSDAAHELRTPLASMRAQLDVDLAHEATADYKATSKRMSAEVDRMQRLVDDLLGMARAENGSLDPARVGLVDLDDVVLAEISVLAPRVAVRIDTSAVSAASVRGNLDDLRRVVTNLLTNATRHAREQVVVSVYEEGGHSFVRVDDDGSGIPEADRDRVFERFVRLDEARNRDSGGSGLGLALSREIAALHEGDLIIETSSLGGARFVLRLPVAGPGSTG